MQEQVDSKQLQLTAFKKQYEVGQKRLAALKSDKGNEEILIEHGYIPPGDRILLFPATGDEQRAAALPKNDLSPHEPLTGAPSPGAGMASGWRSAGSVLHDWWQTLRAGAGVKPVASEAGSKQRTPAKSAGASTSGETSTAADTEKSSLKTTSDAATGGVGAASPAASSDSREVTSIHAKPTAVDDSGTTNPATAGAAAASADTPDADTPDSATANRPGPGNSGDERSSFPRSSSHRSGSHSGSDDHSGSKRHSLSVETD
ncbi:MAG: hypothetical protein JOZ57_06140, partial [Abitibacteriaceae bacterium]|nr:hypothetical protein [Abditibacteriaceae bacterium]